MSDLLNQLKGEQLSAVTFVHDYVQLAFDGPSISVYMPMSVEANGATIRTGDEQFRNAICAQIAKQVENAALRVGEALVITFNDGSRILISLREDDYSGPEAFMAQGFGDSWTVHRIDD
jgi:hypothetical protein